MKYQICAQTANRFVPDSDGWVSLALRDCRSVLKTARAASERDFLMILLAYRHGLRASEVCALRTTAVAGGFLTVARLKGSRKTIQPLSPSDNPLLDERTAIAEYLKAVPKGARLFPITREHFTRLFKRYAEAAGIPSHLAHVHSCKHAVAYEMVSRIPINDLQQFLGHKSLNSTGYYLRTTDHQASSRVADAFVSMS